MAKEPEARREPEVSESDPGRPGGGAGRRDEVGGSGVHPASAGSAPRDAELRTQAAWGQGERGAAGYADSGSSELFFYDSELQAAEQGASDRAPSPDAQTRRSAADPTRGHSPPNASDEGGAAAP